MIDKPLKELVDLISKKASEQEIEAKTIELRYTAAWDCLTITTIRKDSWSKNELKGILELIELYYGIGDIGIALRKH